jgi:hypothetical protein
MYIDCTFTKSMESYQPSQGFEKLLDGLSNKDIIDDVEMKKSCIEIVRSFYKDGLDLEYIDKGLQSRCEIVCSFYDEVKEKRVLMRNSVLSVNLRYF